MQPPPPLFFASFSWLFLLRAAIQIRSRRPLAQKCLSLRPRRRAASKQNAKGHAREGLAYQSGRRVLASQGTFDDLTCRLPLATHMQLHHASKLEQRRAKAELYWPGLTVLCAPLPLPCSMLAVRL